jgi:hypothetical protein
VFENEMLGDYLDLKREEYGKDGGNYVIISFVIC